MNDWTLYRAAIKFLPCHAGITATDFPAEKARKLEKLLRRHKCSGAALCLFSESGVTQSLYYGSAAPGVPMREDIFFRTASISKFITALGVMKLCEQGIVTLEDRVSSSLPFSVEHPAYPDTSITLKMLLSHTGGIHDGTQYNEGIAQNVPADTLLKGDSHTSHAPGTLWEYSNFGAGLVGSYLEAKIGIEFDALMKQTVFDPLGIPVTCYPPRVQGILADARRVLPPQRQANFCGAARQSRPLPDGKPNPLLHYNLAHGNFCLTARSLCEIGRAAMTPGFLSRESLEQMRAVITPFGVRARNLSQGIGTFVLQDDSIFPRPLYGHQGMAYGAVHGLFFDPVSKQGIAVLTTGASEARDGVLADLNKALLMECLH